MRFHSFFSRGYNTVLAFLCAIFMSVGFTACDDLDAPVDINPLGNKIIGTFYQLYEVEGTITDTIVTTLPLPHDYTKIVETYEFREDGTGIWNRFFFDDETSEPFADLGGGTGGLGSFKFHSTEDGTISLTLDNYQQAPSAKPYSPYHRSLTFADDKISATGIDGRSLTMSRANVTWEEMFNAWLLYLHGGAAAVSYNINDADFTPTTWRDQEAIYIWDGSTKVTSTNIKNPDTYVLVNMPWYMGDVQTNLPEDFCDDITPENGWEWVLNRCGSTSVPNNNYFALYNKYTGVLRFFFYMPFEFTTGNDHVWQVSMTDNLAQHSTWKYGLLPDKTISNKSAINQTHDNTYMTYVTPWTNYMSDDGLITPNAGWWAFDLDFSQINATEMDPLDKIRLQMRSWNVQHVSLNSTMAAALKGSYTGNLDADVNLVKSQHISNSAKGITFKLANITGNLSTIIGKLMSETVKFSELFNPTIAIAKAGCNLAGIKTEGSQEIDGDIKGKMEGTIMLDLKGTIDSEGTIRGSAPTVGVPSPTILVKDFDTKNSHFGQGVWNLKKAPEVYTSPIDWLDDAHLVPYFFNPNSIEVELNPNVFPESDIEWISVESTCSTNHNLLDNAAMRSAYGLQTTCNPTTDITVRAFRISTDFDMAAKIDGRGQYQNTALYDYLYASSDKMGFSYTRNDTLRGREYKGFWLEPVMLNKTTKVPSLEVNVIVQVKLKTKDAPVILSRTYLPEYKKYDYADLQNTVKQFTASYRHSELYDYQMKRIEEICKIYSLKYERTDLKITKATEGNYGNASASNLFNGNYNDPWYVRKADRENNMWYAEFESTQKSIRPKSYTLCVRENNLSFPNRNPRNWKLKAKLNEGDGWVLIDEVEDDRELRDKIYYATYTFDLDVTGKDWKYFRLEITENWGDDIMNLGEFYFNY